MSEIIYRDLSYKLCGLMFYVHNKLGRFRKEKEYAEALGIVLGESGLDFKRESAGNDEILGKKFSQYRMDFLIGNKIVIELKAKRFLGKDDYFQLKKYLELNNLRLGLLVNFRDKYLKPKRVLNKNNL